MLPLQEAFYRSYGDDVAGVVFDNQNRLDKLISDHQSELLKTVGFCVQAHAGQTRRNSKVPYAVHPIQVARLLLREPGQTSLWLLQAALLHDVVEDTDVTLEDLREIFPYEVVDLVDSLTDRSDAHEHRLACIRAMSKDQNADAIKIKMADRLANVTDTTNEYSEVYRNKPDVVASTQLLLEAAESNGLDHTRLYKDLRAIYPKPSIKEVEDVKEVPKLSVGESADPV